MSEHDNLTPAQREIGDKAITEAGRILAHARRRRDEAFASGGIEAVLAQAGEPVTTTREKLAALYLGWRAEAERQAAGRGSLSRPGVSQRSDCPGT